MIFYISPSGLDTNNGSQASPWKSLKRASSVPTGSVIHIGAGTYVETQQSFIAPGVSIEGEGASSTIIKSSLTGTWSTLLSLESSSLTNGGQTISDLTLDGQYISESNFKTWTGISTTFRHNVIINNCQIIGFYDRGVIFNGNGDSRSTIPTDPGIYTTGNKVTNCTFLNTARNNTGNYIGGQLNIGGTKGMEILGNIMIQDQRVAGKNGEPIKYWGSGYNLGLRIVNNVLKRLNFSSNQYNGSNGDWNFAIELFNSSGLEIGGNTLQGSIDLNYNRKGSYPYSFWCHDNVSDHSPFNQREEDGIILEFESGDFIIENNKFFNQAVGITFNVRTPNENGGYNNPKPVGGYSAVVNGIIRNNLFAENYSSFSYGNCCGSVGVQFLTEGGSNDAYVRSLQISNNTFVAKPGNPANTALDLTQFGQGSSDGILINKNVFQGYPGEYLAGGAPGMLNTATKDNDIWLCGNNNNPSWNGVLVNTGNLKQNPNLDSNYNNSLGIGYNSGTTPPPPTNQPPSSNAGTDKSLILPTNSVSLQGSGIDPEGGPITFLWTKQSGPIGGNIVSPSSATTQISSLQQGTYIYRLTTTDDKGASSFDEASIVVNPATPPTNQPPVVNAGPDQTLLLTATLSGSATDDEAIVSYKWTKQSGPSGLVFQSPNSATCVVTGLRDGTYVFKLTATDNKGLSSFDTTTLTLK